MFIRSLVDFSKTKKIYIYIHYNNNDVFGSIDRSSCGSPVVLRIYKFFLQMLNICHLLSYLHESIDISPYTKSRRTDFAK